jgi:DNA-binding transcriptional MerR regulator
MSPTDTLSPTQVARATGLSPDTLRHYERRGLLPKPVRTSAGYRRYPPSTINRVELIQRALVIGFSLEDLRQVLMERDRGGVPCRKVLGLVKGRLAALEQRLNELTILRAELVTLVGDWERQLGATPDGKQARLLENLGNRPAIEDGRRRRHSRGVASAKSPDISSGPAANTRARRTSR